MHSWSDDNFDWNGLDDVGDYIGLWLRRWVRMDIRQIKEKFGTLRIYCSFGWNSFYSVYHPGYCWSPKWWPYDLDRTLSDYLMPIFNKVIIPIQQKAYTWRYKKAVQKWPHLYKEIVSCADWGELFDGIIPEYKHSDFWKKV